MPTAIDRKRPTKAERVTSPPLTAETVSRLPRCRRCEEPLPTPGAVGSLETVCVCGARWRVVADGRGFRVEEVRL